MENYKEQALPKDMIWQWPDSSPAGSPLTIPNHQTPYCSIQWFYQGFVFVFVFLKPSQRTLGRDHHMEALHKYILNGSSNWNLYHLPFAIRLPLFVFHLFYISFFGEILHEYFHL